MEAAIGFSFFDSKITVDGDSSHEIKKMFATWKESCDKARQHIKKQRHTLLTNFSIVKAMRFPVVRYRYKTWTIRNTEHQRIDAFEM